MTSKLLSLTGMSLIGVSLGNKVDLNKINKVAGDGVGWKSQNPWKGTYFYNNIYLCASEHIFKCLEMRLNPQKNPQTH